MSPFDVPVSRLDAFVSHTETFAPMGEAAGIS